LTCDCTAIVKETSTAITAKILDKVAATAGKSRRVADSRRVGVEEFVRRGGGPALTGGVLRTLSSTVELSWLDDSCAPTTDRSFQAASWVSRRSGLESVARKKKGAGSI
jgi:hypothetical protein